MAQNQSLFHYIQQKGGNTLPIMVCPKSTFLQMSQTLEDAIIANSKSALIFVGFQKPVEWYETTPHFRELVQSATQLCLFTDEKAPSSQSDKELYIELEESSPLLQSWFLLVISRSFSALLCSQTPPDSNLANLNHAIEVFFTFDITLITHALNILEDTVTSHYPEKVAYMRQIRNNTMLQNPDGMLVSQIMTKILNYGFSTQREVYEQSALLETMMININQCSYVIETDRTGKSTMRRVLGDFEKLTGYTINVLDDPLALSDKMLHPDDKPRFYARTPDLIPNTLHTDDYRFIHKDGHTVWMRLTTRTSETADGWVHYGTFQDVTSAYEAKQTQLENKQLENALEHQKGLISNRANLLHSAVHEIRDPLTVILLASQTVERYNSRLSNDEIRAYLQTIQNQVLKLRTVLDGMRSVINTDE